MPAIIALVLAAIVAFAVLGFVLHILFSPWLLVAVAIVAWIKFRPGHSRPWTSGCRGWTGSRRPAG
jgi:hypothetical protein